MEMARNAATELGIELDALVIDEMQLDAGRTERLMASVMREDPIVLKNAEINELVAIALGAAMHGNIVAGEIPTELERKVALAASYSNLGNLHVALQITLKGYEYYKLALSHAQAAQSFGDVTGNLVAECKDKIARIEAAAREQGVDLDNIDAINTSSE